ncbi:MAG: iron uptake porin, partial [Gloeomargaritaceae cyanobacterium C42_A2020_066]|nr:iron uptake porin [Gloeomargaritaceae cyanobacterium C42_A2020_066]
TLEAQQFSTTTKLRGEVIFYPAGVAEADQAQTTIQQAGGVPTVQTQDNTIFAYRVRLNFDTSFTGQDRLRTRLQVADTTPFAGPVTGTNETRLGFDSDTDGALLIDKLFYEFPFDNGKGKAVITAVNGEANEFFDTYSGQLESSGNGALSRFGRFNPLMYRVGGAQGAGAGTFIMYDFNKTVGIGVGYLALNTNSTVGTGAPVSAANPDQGLFGGNYSVFAQVNVKPTKDFKFGLGYSRSYGTGFDNVGGSNGFGVNVTGSTGTSYAADPFGSAKSGDDTPTETNGVNLMFSWTALPQMIISGWFGYTWANALSSSFVASNTVQKNDQAQILTAALQFAFPDPFGRKGDLGGFIVGLPPYVTDNDSGQIVNGQLIKRQNEDVPVHIEGLYRFQVNRNLRITPGFIIIANPQGNADNDTLFVYTVRSTFTF